MGKWVKASESLPTIELNGDKILLYRISNEGQLDVEISVYSTAKVRHCNPNETWWMDLPAPPGDHDVLAHIHMFTGFVDAVNRSDGFSKVINSLGDDIEKITNKMIELGIDDDTYRALVSILDGLEYERYNRR